MAVIDKKRKLLNTYQSEICEQDIKVHPALFWMKGSYVLRSTIRLYP